MSNSPSHLPVSIHPAIRNLNVRQISKMIATRIIEATELQIQFNSYFCHQLGVADHLNTYQAVTYFIDNQFFERYGFQQFTLINIQTVYKQLFSDFSTTVHLDTYIT